MNALMADVKKDVRICQVHINVPVLQVIHRPMCGDNVQVGECNCIFLYSDLSLLITADK